MVPYFYAMDRVNYSRWLPVYLADMNRLHDTHPDVYQQFLQGTHAISRSSQPFAQVWSDMVLEQSINLDSKSKCGIVGITKRPEALAQWFLTSHQRASITSMLKEMCGIDDLDRVGSHKESSPKRVKRDEDDIRNHSSVIEKGLMKTPFLLEDADG